MIRKIIKDILVGKDKEYVGYPAVFHFSTCNWWSENEYKVFTVLKFFCLVILTFKESLFLKIGNIANWSTLPRVRKVFLKLPSYVSSDYCIIVIINFRVILNEVFLAVASQYN